MSYATDAKIDRETLKSLLEDAVAEAVQQALQNVEVREDRDRPGSHWEDGPARVDLVCDQDEITVELEGLHGLHIADRIEDRDERCYAENVRLVVLYGSAKVVVVGDLLPGAP